MSFLDKILPSDNKKRKIVAVAITVFLAGLLSLWGIYGVGQYGLALFIFTPMFIGAGSTILYGYKNQITLKEAWQIGALTLLIFCGGLLVFAIERLSYPH